MGIIRLNNVILVSLALLSLSGCAAKRMQVDFVGFEKVYAETSNRELLLNLARLQNHDPTYFFKLGTIQSAYRMSASVNGTGQKVTQGTGSLVAGQGIVGAGAAVVGSGTPTLTYENDPTFTFIPVNDETNAQLLLKPIQPETFYNLYLQGWRVDQLFRLMVDRIELTTPAADGHACSVETIRNVPPPVFSKADAATDADYLRETSNYVTFLRISALVYGLQKHGHLLLRDSTRVVPYDLKAGIAAGSAAEIPKASDIANAAAKNQSWELDDKTKQWVLGQQMFSATFYLNPRPTQPVPPGAQPDESLGQIKKNILLDGRMAGLENGRALDTALGVLAGGFSIEGAPTSEQQGDDSCSSVKKTGVATHLVMRSLIGIMAAAAQEEAAFDALAKRNPVIPVTQSSETPLTFLQAVPRIERVPSLRLKHIAGDKGTKPLVELSYADTNYVITDSANPDTPENQYWNRDMFRLITQLTAQVTVDISKFPLPGFVQIRTQ